MRRRPSVSIEAISFKHTRHGHRPWRTFGTNVFTAGHNERLFQTCFMECWHAMKRMSCGCVPLDISGGLRPSVNMQWDLSEVLLGACCCLRLLLCYPCGRITCVPTFMMCAIPSSYLLPSLLGNVPIKREQ